MVMQAYMKMQIEAIKNPERLYVLDFEDTVLLIDGWKGPYIKKDEVLINLDKIKHPEKKEEFNPKTMKLTKIKRTNHLIITSGNRIVNRFDTEDGEKIWVRNDWMKEYENAFSYATEETKTVVIPIGMHGEPMGIVLCMKINNEEN